MQNIFLLIYRVLPRGFYARRIHIYTNSIFSWHRIFEQFSSVIERRWNRFEHSRFTLQIEKPPSFWDNLSNFPSKAPFDTFTDLKETFNEIPILHSQSWRNKGMNISLASRISRIPWNRVNYPSLNTNNTFYYKNISYHVVSLESRY